MSAGTAYLLHAIDWRTRDRVGEEARLPKDDEQVWQCKLCASLPALVEVSIKAGLDKKAQINFDFLGEGGCRVCKNVTA